MSFSIDPPTNHEDALWLVSYTKSLRRAGDGCSAAFKVCRCDAFPYPHAWALSLQCKQGNEFKGVILDER